MRLLLVFILYFSTIFASNLPKEHILNNIKAQIQKEEILALAVNRYIIENAKLPIKDGTIDWNELEKAKYLINFDKKSPFTNKELLVVADENNNLLIQGIVTDKDFNSSLKYAYNIYTDSIFRVNTIAPKNSNTDANLKTNLINGTQIKLQNIQKEIALKLKNNENILFSNQSCNDKEYFYELNGQNLIYKYCKVKNDKTTKLDVYQKAPLYLEDSADLEIIRGNIGDRAYVINNNGVWEEFYFDNESGEHGWVNISTGKAIGGGGNSDDDVISQKLNHIPEGKELFIRPYGGCYLAYGDVFCWGKNDHRQTGIENYGQLDTNLTADYINTPVMLKSAIEDIDSTLQIKSKKWYNSPYRAKFEKMAMNSTNICAISTDFYESDEEDSSKKKGVDGDLYCNGKLDWNTFHNPYLDGDTVNTSTSILSKHIFFAQHKNNSNDFNKAIFLKDIAMVEGKIVVLSTTGELWQIDGISSEPSKIVVPENNTAKFIQVVATRDTKMFGALSDEGYFYIWGDTPKETILNPTRINNTKYKADEKHAHNIRPQSATFILKEDNLNRFVYINSFNETRPFNPQNADEISAVAYYNFKDNIQTPYINQNMELKEPNGQKNFLECKDGDNKNCLSSTDDVKLFNDSLFSLNSLVEDEDSTSASFSDIGLFQSEIAKSTSQSTVVVDSFENFEGSSPVTTDWNSSQVYKRSGGSVSSQFLGPFGKAYSSGYNGSGGTITTNGSQQIYKIYTFSNFKNGNVKISFDMYELGSWDSDNKDWIPEGKYNEEFFIYINDILVRKDMYGNDSNGKTNETKDGISLGNITIQSGILSTTTTNLSVRKHTYEFTVKLDSNGRVKLGFGANLSEEYRNESFGIDNVRISNIIDNTSFSNDKFIEDFENRNYDSWFIPRGPLKTDSYYKEIFNTYPIFDGGAASTFLGRFGRANGQGTYFGGNNGDEQVYKVFGFGSNFANKNIKLSFDAYIIDHWKFNSGDSKDNDELFLFLNGAKETIYDAKNHSSYNGTEIIIPNTDSKKDLKIKIEKNIVLDEYGNIRLGFGAYNAYNNRHVEKEGTNEMMSWGIDNIEFENSRNSNSGSESLSSSHPSFICTKTGLGVRSQLYCWGNVGRSLPILNTGLYDISKIPSVNKLFVTKESEKDDRMSYTQYDNEGSLFLKYPTYISGFDYDFKFK